jgi:exonuclease SbcD
MHLTDDQAYILENLEFLLKDEKPDAYIIAGDIYDRSVPPPEAVELLSSHLERVTRELKIPVIMIAGNHDGAERLDFCSTMMKGAGLHISGIFRGSVTPVVLEDEHGPVYFYSIPYADPERMKPALEEDETLTHNSGITIYADMIRAALPAGARSVALAHAFVNGGSSSDSERPLSIGGTGAVSASAFSGFCYTALGHLHAPQNISDTIRYSGSLMKYSLSEAEHRKSVTIVEIDRDKAVNTKEVHLTPRRDLRIVKGSLKEILESKDQKNREDYVAVHLTDREAVYDAMNRLRSVYPNIIHLERTEYNPSGEQLRSTTGLKHSDLELFSSFYFDVTGIGPDERELDIVTDVLEESAKAGADL